VPSAQRPCPAPLPSAQLTCPAPSSQRPDPAPGSQCLAPGYQCPPAPSSSAPVPNAQLQRPAPSSNARCLVHKDAWGQETAKPTHKRVSQSPLYLLLEHLTKTTNGGTRLHRLWKRPSQRIKGCTSDHFTFFGAPGTQRPAHEHRWSDPQDHSRACTVTGTAGHIQTKANIANVNTREKRQHERARGQKISKPMDNGGTRPVLAPTPLHLVVASRASLGTATQAPLALLTPQQAETITRPNTTEHNVITHQ
jgi:hypothetical protein